MRLPFATLSRPILYCVLAYALFVSGLSSLGLVGPDEPRYADVARGMMRSGDYVTPRLFGEPWFEKPPLYYWSAALLFHLQTDETMARLPSAFAAGFFLVFWFWFARRFYGDRAAKFSCLILATTAGWIGFARAAAMDMLLTTTLSAALALLAVWLWENRAAALWGFYALLAVATLAKGPLAIALAGLAVIGYILHQRDWAIVRRVLLTPAVSAFAAIALPWYALCYARNGSAFVQEFFIRHNVERLVSGEAIGHPQPFWFYIPIVLAALFPWTATLLLPLAGLARKGRSTLSNNPQHVYLFYWIVLPFLFFSAAQNKLPGYLLPILPPLTLWIGAAIGERYSDQDAQPLLKGALAASALLLLLLSPAIVVLLPEALASGLGDALAQTQRDGLWSQIAGGPVPLVAWAALAGAGVASAALLWRGQTLAAAFSVVLGVCWVVLLMTSSLAPAINRVASMRTVAASFQEDGIAPQHLAVLYLHRNQIYGLGYYLGGLSQPWTIHGAAPHVRFVAAREDLVEGQVQPGAHSNTWFPGQRIRLWILPPPAASASPPNEPPGN
jgi:4-amino-4-deoxy-L-arabinose transferase-like glycosyltransferase